MPVNSGKHLADYKDPWTEVDFNSLKDHLGVPDSILVDTTAGPIVASGSPWVDACAPAPHRPNAISEQTQISYNQLMGRYPEDKEIIIRQAERKILDNILNYVAKFVRFDRFDDFGSIKIRATFDPSDMP